jgi:beta-phosphoglucomutase-like phosphatase (HAD superfamily)
MYFFYLRWIGDFFYFFWREMTTNNMYGVIFDMDGVISNTQIYHGQAEIDILADYDIRTISPDDMAPITTEWIGNNFAGMQLKEWMGALFATHGKSDLFDIHVIEEAKKEKLSQLYAHATITSIPGSIALIKTLAASDRCYTAVVTASMPDAMHTVLDALGVREYFNTIVSIYDFDPDTGKQFRSKGDPDVYMRVLDGRGIPHNAFVMIEDGDTGMRGAIAAGGKAIAVL